MHEDSSQDMQDMFIKLSKKIESKLASITILDTISVWDTFLIEQDFPIEKDKIVLKFISVWKCDKIEDEIWWELKYQSQFQLLTLQCYFLRNGVIPVIQSRYSKIFSARLFDKYSSYLANSDTPYQFCIHPQIGELNLQMKSILSSNQFEQILPTMSFLKENITHIKLMVKIIYEIHHVFFYFQSSLPKFPQIDLFSKLVAKQNSPHQYLHALETVLLEVNDNCEENLEALEDKMVHNQFISNHYVPFSHNFLDFVNFYIGKTKNIENQKPQISLKDLTSLIFDSYDISTRAQNSIPDEMFLARKISIISKPFDINWRIIAKGGFGLIQKASVKYQLQDFNNFSNKKQIREGLIIRKSDTKYLKKIAHEQKIFELLKNQFHENIEPHYIPAQKIYSTYIFTKYEQNLSLDKYLQNNRKTISINTIFQFCSHICKGLLFLKEKNIVHLDVKPNNVLVSKELKAKITDFGQAYYSKQKSQKHSHAYTTPYAPAQVFLSSNHFLTDKVDVYAFGVTMYKLIFGSHIWGKIHDRGLFQEKLIEEGELQILMNPQLLSRSGIPEVILPSVNLILRCIKKQQKQRPNFFYISLILTLIRNYLDKMILIFPTNQE